MNGPLLVILPHNPGDVVMALAAVARLRAAFPDIPVDYLVGEECRELAEGNPLLREVHPLPRRALRDAWASGDAGAVLSRLEACLGRLDAAGYAASLNLFQESYGGLLQGLLRADRKAGLELVAGSHLAVKSRFLEHLFAVPAARRDNAWHAVDIYIRAARELVDPGRARPWTRPAGWRASLPPSSPPPGWDGPDPREYLAFHPGSAWIGKRWPEENWSALAEACLRRGLSLVFTGSGEESASLRRIRGALPGAVRGAVHDWSGRTTLLGAAWIHSRARLTVTGDTVAMHLAAACGTPTLALFGPSNPVETGPYGPGHFIWQTDPDPPSRLVFDRPHAGLASLSPAAVAAFILDGEAPPEAALWETAWDTGRDCQVLRDRRGAPHPNQARSLGLMDILDGRTGGDGGFAMPSPLPGGEPPEENPPIAPEAARVARALESALAGGIRGPDAEALRDLEAADRALAAATDASVVWEAYRIAINALPLEDLRIHLELRRRRFGQALREAAALGTPGRAGNRAPGRA